MQRRAFWGKEPLPKMRTVAIALAFTLAGACRSPAPDRATPDPHRARAPTARPVPERFCDEEGDPDAACRLFCRSGGTGDDCAVYDPTTPITEVTLPSGDPLPRSSFVGMRMTDEKYRAGRARAVDTITVHTTEVGLRESARTLSEDPGKSVPFLVDARGRIYQLMSVRDTAWHAGNRVYNERSVGIEHVGCSLSQGCNDYAYVKTPRGEIVATERRGVTLGAPISTGGVELYPDALYDASAALSRAIRRAFRVPLDRAHVIGHDQIPNRTKIAEDSAPCAKSVFACENEGRDYGGASHHTDPGLAWDWCKYMALLGGACRDDLDECPNRRGQIACAPNWDAAASDGHLEVRSWAAISCEQRTRDEGGRPTARWVGVGHTCYGRGHCAGAPLQWTDGGCAEDVAGYPVAEDIALFARLTRACRGQPDGARCAGNVLHDCRGGEPATSRFCPRGCRAAPPSGDACF